MWIVPEVICHLTKKYHCGAALWGRGLGEQEGLVTKKLESFNNKCLRRIYPRHNQGQAAHWSNHQCLTKEKVWSGRYA